MMTDAGLERIAQTIDRVRALHRESSEEGLPTACFEGDCDHLEAIRGEECPPVSFKVCRHCMDNAHEVSDFLDGQAWPSFVMWPCATIRALDAPPVLALLNGGSR